MPVAIIVVLVFVYMFSLFGTWFTVGKKNSWNADAMFAAAILCIIPIFNTLYLLLNIKIFFKDVNL